MTRYRKSCYPAGTTFTVRATDPSGDVVWLSTYDHEVPAFAKAWDLEHDQPGIKASIAIAESA